MIMKQIPTMRLRILWLALLCAVVGGMRAERHVMIVPEPVSVEENGETFAWPDAVGVYVSARFQQAAGVSAAHTQQMLNQVVGADAYTAAKAQAQVVVELDKTVAAEAYRLKVGRKGVEIKASGLAGCYYALQTLLQLFPAEVQATRTPAGATVPGVRIYDVPRYAWRGFMLDESRHFFGVKEVKRVLDLMARYKLNRFHWHLTDDQGWRIQIMRLPRLVTVGSWRNSKKLTRKGEQPDHIQYGGYYTQDQLRDIVAYAKARCIEIVPEVDMPGHSQAAIASYPDLLACAPGPFEVYTGMAINPNVMNTARTTSVEFAKAVIDELIGIFPYGYIHLGGDECPTRFWEIDYEHRLKLFNMGSKNFHDLQTNFYAQLVEHMRRKPASEQRRFIFWNESLSGNPAHLGNAAIMVWTDVDNAVNDAVSKGFPVILSPQIPFYINRRQSTRADEPDTQGQGNETLEAVYNYQPPQPQATQAAADVIGVQANCWTEFIDNPQTLEYMLLPRLAAVAETAWTPQVARAYDRFLPRAKHEADFYQAAGYAFGRAAFE